MKNSSKYIQSICVPFCKTQQTTRKSIPDHAVVSHTKGCLIPTKRLEMENFYFYKPTMGDTTPALQCSAAVGALRAPTSGFAACAPCTRAVPSAFSVQRVSCWQSPCACASHVDELACMILVLLHTFLSRSPHATHLERQRRIEEVEGAAPIATPDDC